MGKVQVSTNGMVSVPGQLVFADLVTPKTIENSTRYSIGMRVSKDSPAFQELWAEAIKQGQRVWKESAKSKLSAIQSAIKAGVAPANSPISVQDGDLYQPEYNAGFWWVRASRPKDKGRPAIYGADGTAIDADDASQAGQVPGPGDGVVALINVWCQPEYSRMNLTLVAIRLAIKGEPLTAGPSAEAVEEATQGLLSLSLPKAIPGVQPAAGQLTAGSSAPKASKRSAKPAELPELPLEGEMVDADGGELDLIELN